MLLTHSRLSIRFSAKLFRDAPRTVGKTALKSEMKLTSKSLVILLLAIMALLSVATAQRKFSVKGLSALLGAERADH